MTVVYEELNSKVAGVDGLFEVKGKFKVNHRLGLANGKQAEFKPEGIEHKDKEIEKSNDKHKANKEVTKLTDMSGEGIKNKLEKLVVE